jgi:hypothetical protein
MFVATFYQLAFTPRGQQRHHESCARAATQLCLSALQPLVHGELALQAIAPLLRLGHLDDHARASWRQIGAQSRRRRQRVGLQRIHRDARFNARIAVKHSQHREAFHWRRAMKMPLEQRNLRDGRRRNRVVGTLVAFVFNVIVTAVRCTGVKLSFSFVVCTEVGDGNLCKRNTG